MPTIRLIFAYSTLTFFLVFFFLSGLNKNDQVSHVVDYVVGNKGPPDFSLYNDLITLSPDEFSIDNPDRRIILIGDIHGMYDPFQSLLSHLSYKSPNDVLISAGDIIAKGSLKGSLNVLSWMTEHNITAVRGNHDQKVIEWRSWINWIQSLPSGKRWLRTTTQRFEETLSSSPSLDVDAWVEEERKKDRRRNGGGNRKWWDRIPEDWKMFGDHYRIAAAMTDSQYNYLVERPLKIWVPHLHVYIAHAGVLASIPGVAKANTRQPLATIPRLPRASRSSDHEAMYRQIQELKILNDIPDNKNPWVTLNMRGLVDDQVVRTKNGTPWSEVFNSDMKMCRGFGNSADDLKKKKKHKSLPCRPATVVYGHAASRGLDLKRWTIGLDSGCVYERRLSALVLGGKLARQSLSEAEEEDDESPLEDDAEDDEAFGAYNIKGHRVGSKVRFGDRAKGKIISVSCD
ncbi:calcineurin-like phosphoesterase [Mycena floridula]|nr:calcineurin-like phosphoesterase [Mycena floridula]